MPDATTASARQDGRRFGISFTRLLLFGLLARASAALRLGASCLIAFPPSPPFSFGLRVSFDASHHRCDDLLWVGLAPRLRGGPTFLGIPFSVALLGCSHLLGVRLAPCLMRSARFLRVSGSPHAR
ncbi:hypothetical protein [Roseomonas sp. HF4]|uniref:hypothetical protein n=1 Tax=Roseomonas sp. HF4 TaxID=2562313 RepID=UPI0010C0BBA5|nr:hypothetical protein [Roseomonas sp. HF4]